VASDIGRTLRAAVARRAGSRCEYCLIHEQDAGFRHQLDHIVSRKHGGDSTLANLAYSCVTCNRNKGADVASMDLVARVPVRLFHPRSDRWSDHFQITGDRIEPLTPVGEATVRLLRLNSGERLLERRLFRQ
jgi:hypothetical protein